MKKKMLEHITKNKFDIANIKWPVNIDKRLESKLKYNGGESIGKSIKVRTLKDLKRAIDLHYHNIIVEGKLAKHVRSVYKAKSKLSFIEKKAKSGDVITSSGLIAAGITETAIITAIITIGLLVVVALLLNYDVEVSIPSSIPQSDKQLKLIFKKANNTGS